MSVINLKNAKIINLMDDRFKELYKKINGKDYDLISVMPFAHAYAEWLLNNNNFTDYEIFVETYNSIIENDELFKIFKDVQTKNALFNSNYEQILITDKRTKIKNSRFAHESDFESFLYQYLKEFFGNEILIEKQKQLKYGVSDLVIGNEVAIELKKDNAKRMDVYQTFEYSFDKNIKNVCLIAAEFDNDVLSIAKKLKVECYKYSFVKEDYESDCYPIGFYIEKISETDNNNFDNYLNEVYSCGMFEFSHYEPSFSFYESYKKAFEVLKNISETNMQIMMKILERKGIDTSKCFENAVQEYFKASGSDLL